MNCEQVNEYLIEFVEDRLEAGRRAEVETHLAACAACRERAAAFRAVSSALDDWQAAEPSVGFDARLAEKIELAESRRWWPAWLSPAYVGALALLLLLAGVFLWTRHAPVEPPAPVAVKTSTSSPSAQPPATQPRVNVAEDEEVQMLENLAVLEDAQMLEDFDVLSEIGHQKTKTKSKL